MKNILSYSFFSYSIFAFCFTLSCTTLAFNPQRRDCLLNNGTYFTAQKIENNVAVDEVAFCQLNFNNKNKIVGALDLFNYTSLHRKMVSLTNIPDDSCEFEIRLFQNTDQTYFFACEFPDQSLLVIH